ncbi:MAG: phospholipid/cholesterol/gamma-HCH transport system substrate-binding protein [Myxococcales bacterium]|nr:phospholipid/cholesterol/gamma-HCH transport system substrate-binding protein [Myxococcales bacterium]
MRRSWASVTVGLLVLLVAGATYFIIRATSERTSSGKGYVVWALFHDASGLFEKSRVQTAGISIGQIEKRELDPKTAHAKISIRINPDIKLWSNAVVSKKSASLLGEYYLEVDPGTPFGLVAGQRQDMTPLKNGDQIKDVREPTAMGDLMSDIGTILPILRDILTDVKRMTSGPISDIAENVNQLIETNSAVLERLLNRVDHIAANIEGVTTAEAGDVKQSIQNVREITENIKSLVGSSQNEVQNTGSAVRGSLEKLQRTIDNLDRTLKNTEAISGRVEKGEGTVGRLLNDDTIARNVEDITEDASTFVRGITKLQTIVGLRTEYNFVSSSFKNYLQVQLVPRPDKFYLIELVEDPRGYREATTTVTNSSRTGTTSETQVTISERLRFTLMFGKRVGPIAGRFGIKESTGGVGVDLHLFDDRLNLSLDVFDARTNQYPRIKPSAAIAVWKRNLFLVAGGDDLANLTRARAGAGGGIDWFLGTQLTFNDEDLKSLLLFGGGAAAGSASK